jgi:hypothetical protein
VIRQLSAANAVSGGNPSDGAEPKCLSAHAALVGNGRKQRNGPAQLRIETYTIADLKERLSAGGWFQCNPLPISKQRAWSQVNNPRADADDLALLVAYDGETVVAHLGILPDLAFIGDKEQKIGWLTAWWANPDRKYTGAGLLLLIRALGLYGGRLGASGFSDDASKVYDATRRFTLVKKLDGVSSFARLNTDELLPRRIPSLARISLLLRVIDQVVNLLTMARQYWWQWKNRLPAGGHVEYMPRMDEEADEFIEKHHGSELTKRGATELNWITQYPWVERTPLAKPSSFRFSAPVESYCALNVKVYDANTKLIAVLVLTAIDGHLLVPYCLHESQGPLVARVICEHLIAMRLSRLTVYQPDLVECLKGLRFPWIWTRSRRRAWLLSAECVGRGLESCHVQDGDGDCAFTV